MKMKVMFSVLVLSMLGLEVQAFYNPTTGRWLSRDPVGEQGGNRTITRKLRLLGCSILIASLVGCACPHHRTHKEDLLLTIYSVGVNFRIPAAVALASKTRQEDVQRWQTENRWRGSNAMAVVISDDECAKISSLLSSPYFSVLRIDRKPHITDNQYVVTANSFTRTSYYLMGDNRQLLIQRLSKIADVLEQDAAMAVRSLVDQIKDKPLGNQ